MTLRDESNNTQQSNSTRRGMISLRTKGNDENSNTRQSNSTRGGYHRGRKCETRVIIHNNQIDITINLIGMTDDNEDLGRWSIAIAIVHRSIHHRHHRQSPSPLSIVVFIIVNRHHRPSPSLSIVVLVLPLSYSLSSSLS